jgi:hypothetical protein
MVTRLACSSWPSPPGSRRQVRLSTLRYFEQKFAVIHGNEQLPFATGMPASFSFQRSFPTHLPSGSPRLAERSIGEEPKLRIQTKNPASSAGHVRPPREPLCGLSDGCARFSTSFYPVLMTTLTSIVGGQARFRQKATLAKRALPTSRKYSSILYFVKSHNRFFALKAVDFRDSCGKSRPLSRVERKASIPAKRIERGRCELGTALRVRKTHDSKF